MIRPEPQIIKGLAQAVRQHPELLVWMEGVLAHEMKRLPYAVENPTVFQGRCQMLAELIEFAKEAPAVAAKL
jgi:hypothetical protein